MNAVAEAPAVEPREIPVCPTNAFKLVEHRIREFAIDLPPGIGYDDVVNPALMGACLSAHNNMLQPDSRILATADDRSFEALLRVLDARPGVAEVTCVYRVKLRHVEDKPDYQALPSDHQIIRSRETGRYVGRRISDGAFIGGGDFGHATWREAQVAIWSHASVAQKMPDALKTA